MSARRLTIETGRGTHRPAASVLEDRHVMSLARYHRQMLLPWLREGGQRRLLESHALIIGCGALGTNIADALVRAGVGTLTIVDRDVVELTNLQRQVLFDEADVEQGMPKAEAAKARLARINSGVRVEARVDDFNHRSAERLARGVDIMLDGLDNFETRYLVNDLAVKRGVPYIYGGAVGTSGMAMPILPHPRKRAGARESRVRWSAAESTPCLRCVFPEAPPPGVSPTCDTAGVLGAAVAMVAAHQVNQAIKILAGRIDAIDRGLWSIDVWANETRRFDVSSARDASECPCCRAGRFEYLDGSAGSAATSLCGRNAVQISPAEALIDGHRLDLADMARRLGAHGTFTHNRFMLRGEFSCERGEGGEPLELTLFRDGRAIVKGTQVPETARTVYARYVGV
jgi:adenylyltransferase/sulfurtransferase